MRFGLLLVLACVSVSAFVGCGEASNNAFEIGRASCRERVCLAV